MKIISWNVNGLRAVLKKGFLDFLKKEKPDFLCLQEIKIDRQAIKGLKDSARDKIAPEWDFSGYEEYYNPAERKGYSGTAIFAKNKKAGPGSNLSLLPGLSWDNEGRVQVLDIDGYYLVNIYFPNANHELSRLDFKIEFNNKLLKYLKDLEKEKPLIVCGDYNVAHQEIDLARPRENEGNPGFHPRERAWMGKFLQAGFVDSFRHLHPEKIQYSWWSFRSNARARNVGWRIDYFCVSGCIAGRLGKAFIMDDVAGSDHAPIGIILKQGGKAK